MTHKYRAVKTEVDGVIFDSKKEAKRYQELMLLKRAGEVTEVQLQPEYILMPKFRHKATGEAVRAIKYKADFLVTYADGHQEIEDVKGMRTEIYSMKRKLFMHKYPELIIRET